MLHILLVSIYLACVNTLQHIMWNVILSKKCMSFLECNEISIKSKITI